MIFYFLTYGYIIMIYQVLFLIGALFIHNAPVTCAAGHTSPDEGNQEKPLRLQHPLAGKLIKQESFSRRRNIFENEKQNKKSQSVNKNIISIPEVTPTDDRIEITLIITNILKHKLFSQHQPSLLTQQSHISSTLKKMEEQLLTNIWYLKTFVTLWSEIEDLYTRGFWINPLTPNITKITHEDITQIAKNQKMNIVDFLSTHFRFTALDIANDTTEENSSVTTQEITAQQISPIIQKLFDITNHPFLQQYIDEGANDLSPSLISLFTESLQITPNINIQELHSANTIDLINEMNIIINTHLDLLHNILNIFQKPQQNGNNTSNPELIDTHEITWMPENLESSLIPNANITPISNSKNPINTHINNSLIEYATALLSEYAIAVPNDYLKKRLEEQLSDRLIENQRALLKEFLDNAISETSINDRHILHILHRLIALHNTYGHKTFNDIWSQDHRKKAAAIQLTKQYFMHYFIPSSKYSSTTLITIHLLAEQRKKVIPYLCNMQGTIMFQKSDNESNRFTYSAEQLNSLETFISKYITHFA